MDARQASLLQLILLHIETKPDLLERVQDATKIPNLEMVIKHDLRPTVQKYMVGPVR